MPLPFCDYIKIIGKGKKGARSLTRIEAQDAMSQVLAGKATPDQRGAFLMLLRTREETPEEVTGFLDACRALLQPELASLPVNIDIGCYAGKRRQLPWYLLSVAVLSRQGNKIFLHGAHEPGSGRLYASHILPALGLPSVTSIQMSNTQLNEYGVSYLDLGVVLPELDVLIKLREQFGLRSCANTLGRLLNPSGAPFSVQGVYHEHLDEKHGAVNAAFPAQSSLCFRGDGGEPEVNGERPTNLFITRNGATQQISMAALTERWALKERDMTAAPLLGLWQGALSHAYGEQAVIASLAAYLCLLDSLAPSDALEQARALWLTRPKNVKPFSRATNG